MIMEAMKKDLKTRNLVLTILALFAVAMALFDAFVAPQALKESPVFAFQVGLTAVLALVSSILLIRNRKAMTDEIKLKKLYNYEHDERMATIKAKAGLPMILVTSVLMLVAAIIAGYVNITVFYTLVAAAAAQVLLALVVKVIVMRRM